MTNKLDETNVVLFFGGLDITSVVIDGKPYFVGNDVATVLGYANYRDAVNKRVCIEDKIKKTIEYRGRKRKVTLINDIGVFDLIMSSKLEGVREFKE